MSLVQFGIFVATSDQQPAAHSVLFVFGKLDAGPLPGPPLACVFCESYLRVGISGKALYKLLDLLFATVER
jgi:hypothetical protein